ncbi:GAP family protein [Kineothrix sedimenti]|uniref:GAP family protein n=1 Tax=Kineothrix sedimenti TaxID=3123317 RepID=A0ABZ3EW24_9FIRM
MWGLLLSTIVTSAADSVNPIAITQQFVLQGMVKKPKHIWYFIIPTGLTNFIGGFLAYFGLVAFIGDLLGTLIQKYGRVIFTVELILGIAFLIAVCYLILGSQLKAMKEEFFCTAKSEANAEEQAAKKIKSVSPAALIALGTGATISELSTALPYFAFLAILLNYQLTFLQVTFILAVYNMIYTAPLMILYFIYKKSRSKFDRFYEIIKTQMTKWADILAPAIAGLIGVFLVFHSLSLLLK